MFMEVFGDNLVAPVVAAPPPPPASVPAVASPAGSSTSGTLKATISLGHGGRQPSIRSYFYLIRDSSIDNSASGAADWLALAGLREIHDQYKANPPPDELSEFVVEVAGCLDTPASEDHGSLIALLDKPPVVRDIVPFTTNALNAFRLLPGPIPSKFPLKLVHMPPKKAPTRISEQQRSTTYPPNYEAGLSSYLLPPPSSSLLPDDSRAGLNDFAPSSQESVTATDFMSPPAIDDDAAEFQMPAEKKRRKTEKRRKGK